MIILWDFPGAGYDSAACAGSFEVLAVLANKGRGELEGTGRMCESQCENGIYGGIFMEEYELI